MVPCKLSLVRKLCTYSREYCVSLFSSHVVVFLIRCLLLYSNSLPQDHTKPLLVRLLIISDYVIYLFLHYADVYIPCLFAGEEGGPVKVEIFVVFFEAIFA